jgi:hypothetical protein
MSQLYYWIQSGQEEKDFNFSSTGYRLQDPLEFSPNISAICRGINNPPMIAHINTLFQHNSCIYFVNPEGKITSFLIYNTRISGENRHCNIAQLCSGIEGSRQGIALMQALFQLAENDKKSTKTFLTLSAGTSLKAYYEKLGFEEDGASLMKKEITKKGVGTGGKKRNKTKRRKRTKTRKNKKK